MPTSKHDELCDGTAVDRTNIAREEPHQEDPVTLARSVDYAVPTALNDLDIDEGHVHSEPPSRQTEGLLIDLTRQVLEYTNARRYNKPALLKLVAPEFRGDIEGIIASGRDEFFAQHRRVCEANPNYSIRLIEASAEVDERHGRGRVWGELKVQGWHGDVVRASVASFSWSRREGEWTCFKFQGLRGIRVLPRDEPLIS